MPIIKAAIKHVRKSGRLRAVNRANTEMLKRAVKDIKKLAAQKKKDEYAKMLPAVFSIIDKSAKRNLIHRNNAARKKSALARKLAALK